MPAYAVWCTILVVVVAAVVANLLASFGLFKKIESHHHENCQVIKGPIGAEDLTIHNQIAYISSDNRRLWLKAGLLYDNPHEKMGSLKPDQEGAIYAMDLLPEQPTVRRLPGGGPGFHPHGVSLRESGGEVFLYVISHGVGPDEIREFRVIFDGRLPVELSLQRTLRDALISKNINDLHVRALSSGGVELFVTVFGGETQGTPKGFAEQITKAAWASVVRCVETTEEFSCKTFLPSLSYPNGINVSPDGELLYVACTLITKLHVYSRKNASLLAVVETDSGIDNIDVAPNGDIYIGSHPRLIDFVTHAASPDSTAPSQVLRIRRCDHDSQTPFCSNNSAICGKCQPSGYVVEEVYLTAGHKTLNSKGEQISISASSVGAVDPVSKRLLIGGVFDDGVVVCPPLN